MSKTFSIDSSQVNTVTNKALFRLLKMYAIILAIYIPGRLVIDGKNTAMIIPSIAGFVVVMTLVWFLSYRRIKTITAGLEIVTDESCIEYKAPMTPYKRINWDDMAYVEKSNGVIKVVDKTVNGLTRWWTGKGVILIPLEINGRDELINELYKRAMS